MMERTKGVPIELVQTTLTAWGLPHLPGLAPKDVADTFAADTADNQALFRVTE